MRFSKAFSFTINHTGKCVTQNQAVIVGVVSRGKGCARKNSPGIYTRVKTYLKWIRRITEKKGKGYKGYKCKKTWFNIHYTCVNPIFAYLNQIKTFVSHVMPMPSLLKRSNWLWGQYTVKSWVEARVTIQEIKSLGVLQTETCY